MESDMKDNGPPEGAGSTNMEAKNPCQDKLEDNEASVKEIEGQGQEHSKEEVSSVQGHSKDNSACKQESKELRTSPGVEESKINTAQKLEKSVQSKESSDGNDSTAETSLSSQQVEKKCDDGNTSANSICKAETSIPREHEPLWGILSQIPKKAQRGLLMTCDLILTCVSADKNYIALGTNIGLVFLYDRTKQLMDRLKTDNPSDVVTCVQLHHGIDYQLAVGMASGAVCMFLLPSMKTGLNKQLQKFYVKDMHRSYLTCVEWSTNGMKLFSGDKSGTVVTTEVDFYQGQCKSSVLLIEANTEIIQLQYDHKVLLVSSKHRSLVCRLDAHDNVTQVGQQDRKIVGGFGACFIPGLCKVDDAQLYAVRPGCRIWKAGIDGTVQNTFIFKDLIGNPHQDIPLFREERPLVVKEPQFGKVHIYRTDQLVTWTPLGLYIVNPTSNVVVAYSDKLGYIADITICDDEIFVLRRNVETCIIRLAQNSELAPVKSMLTTIKSASASPRTEKMTMTLQDPQGSPKTVVHKEEKEKTSSAGDFFKKNILGKFKFLDLKSESKESDLEKEISVKQMIDDYGCDDGQNCEVVISPDLPPVVRINSPEMTALHLYQGMAGSPLSPDSGSAVVDVVPGPSKGGSAAERGAPPKVEKSHITNVPSVSTSAADVGDIVFHQKAKKHKKKKAKNESHPAKEDDEISQKSDISQEGTAHSVAPRSDDVAALTGIETKLSPSDARNIADDILQTTEKVLQSESVESQELSSLDSLASASTLSTQKSDESKSEIKYMYDVNKITLPESGSDYKTKRLNDMAKEMDSVHTQPQRTNEGQTSDVPTPASPTAFYKTADASTDDFYKKYTSQTSLDSSAVSPCPPAASTSVLEYPGDDSIDVPDTADDTEASSGPSSMEEKMSTGMLLKLSNSWSEVTVPANVYSLSISDTHIWLTDKSENIHYSALSGAKGLIWRKASGHAKQIAVSSNGKIVWRLHRGTVYAGTKLSAKHPEGLKWAEAVQEVNYIAVDDTTAWYVKTNGDVMMQKGLSADRPCFKSEKIQGMARIRQVACQGNVVWAITEGHKLVYRKGITSSCMEGTSWVEFQDTADILFASVGLGDQNTGWAIDVVGRVWFCCGLSMQTPQGKSGWWQVPISQYFVQDSSALDMLKSLASKFDPQKLSLLMSTSRGGLIAAGGQGVWVCLEYKNVLHVCRGSFQGYHWQVAHPPGMTTNAAWKTLSANVSDLDWGMVWSQQPNGELYVFPAKSRKATKISPSPMFTCIHAGPIAVWGINHEGRVFVRAGMGPFCPQGATWSELDLSQLGDVQLIHVSCNSQFVWAVDCNGLVYQRIGAKAPSDQTLSPAWLPIDSFSEITFTQVVAGPLDWMVWAVDNRRLGYVRQGITDRMPIGREWLHVPGTQITQLTVSSSGVWALNPYGEVLYRYGITRDNVCGNYWKKIPGVFTQISASSKDDLWAINREGQLVQCRTKYLHRRQVSNDPLVQRTISGGSEDGEGEWELV